VSLRPVSARKVIKVLFEMRARSECAVEESFMLWA